MAENRSEKNNSITKRALGVIVCTGIVFVFYLQMILTKAITETLFVDTSNLAAMTFKEALYAISSLVMGTMLGKSPFKMLSLPSSLHKRKWCKRIVFMMTVCYLPMMLIMNVVLQDLDNPTLTFRPLDEIICFITLMFLIGIAEETLFRGIIAESMKHIWGKNNRDVASFISGLFFGLIHLVNLSSADTVGVLCQVCSATAAGMMFADLYYATGSLWPCIIFHSMVDFCALMGLGLFGIGSVGGIISSYTPIMCLLSVILIIIRIILMINRKSRKVFCNFS